VSWHIFSLRRCRTGTDLWAIITFRVAQPSQTPVNRPPPQFRASGTIVRSDRGYSHAGVRLPASMSKLTDRYIDADLALNIIIKRFVDKTCAISKSGAQIFSPPFVLFKFTSPASGRRRVQ
jgi:hypothetical protein